MCLPILESKSTIDHNRMLLQALDEIGLNWVSKYRDVTRSRGTRSREIRCDVTISLQNILQCLH